MAETRAIVYSTPTCPYCHRAKDYLKQKGVPYTDLDISADRRAAQEMMAISGQLAVPVIAINGEVIVGFDPAAIDAALSGKKGLGPASGMYR